MIQAEGVESLSEAELREDCRERGMLGILSVEEMRQQVDFFSPLPVTGEGGRFVESSVKNFLFKAKETFHFNCIFLFPTEAMYCFDHLLYRNYFHLISNLCWLSSYSFQYVI